MSGNIVDSAVNNSMMHQQPNSNMGVYEDKHMQQHPNTLHTMANNEFDNLGEDVLMMNIPGEGNAEQLNKSTKLTLSSKKQYDAHM